MIYQCKFFRIEELVSPEWFEYAQSKGATERLWAAFDADLLIALDNLRDRFGPLVVNNWHNGGTRKDSGLRFSLTATGAAVSQHKFGRAIDFVSSKVTPAEIYQDLVKVGGLKPGFKFRTHEYNEPWHWISRIEYFEGMSWTHIDTARMSGAGDGSIKVFSA